jgi:hypothetical protein
MTTLLETIESVENSHDITVSSFPLRRDLLRTLAKLTMERQSIEQWNFWHERIRHELTTRLQRFCIHASNSPQNFVKRGIFKGLTYENARLASFFLRHAKVRNEFSFGSFCPTDSECVNVVYACIVFPTPGHLDFRHDGERIVIFQGASGRILSLKNQEEPERIESVGHGHNVLQDFMDDVYGYTDAQMAGRIADFSWDDFKNAFEPFLMFYINDDYARLVR